MCPSEPFVIHEQDCAIEGWEEPAAGSVRWRTLLSADRTPTDSLTMGVAEMEPGAIEEFRPHRHEQPEIYYILSGEGIVRISGEDHPVRPGMAIFIPGNALHGALNTGSELLRLLYVFPADSFDQIRYEFPSP